MSMLSISAKLDRSDTNTPWGFRMHGGQDFGCAITIQRVTPGSLAAKCGVCTGDTITKIGDCPTDGMRHKEAQALIMRAGNSLELAIQRYGIGASRPAPQPQAPMYQPSPAPYQPPTQPAYQTPPSQQPNYNTAAKPFVPGGGGTVPVMMNKQYNTPLSMYSVDNVMDSLTGQTRAMNVSGSDDGSSPPPPGGSMLHDHNHNQSLRGLHESGTGQPLAHTNPSQSRSGAPAPPWKTTLEDKPTPVASPTRFEARASTPPWKSDQKEATSSQVTEPIGTTPVWKPPSHTEIHTTSFTSPTQSLVQQEEDKNESPFQSSSSTNIKSKTFKMLQTQLDAGGNELDGSRSASRPGGRGSALGGAHSGAQSSKNVVHTQFNSPMGLYSSSSIKDSYGDRASSMASEAGREGPESGPRLYHPSETYSLVQKEDSNTEPLPEHMHRPSAVKTFDPAPALTASWTNKVSRVGGPAASRAPGPAAAPHTAYSAPAPAASRGGAQPWAPVIPTGPRKMRLGRAGDAKSMPMRSGGGIPICTKCGVAIRGPFVLALDKEWCPDHFMCANPNCQVPLIDIGFVEEEGQVFCERDYAQYFAPTCGKCSSKIVGDCVNALRNTYHPHCFLCIHCRQPIGSGSFHLEDGNPYCDKDWQAMFQTKCYGCQFPIEPGDRWVEALNQNWHSECFNCSTCQINLEGQSFYAKSGRPYCKKHAMPGGR